MHTDGTVDGKVEKVPQLSVPCGEWGAAWGDEPWIQDTLAAQEDGAGVPCVGKCLFLGPGAPGRFRAFRPSSCTFRIFLKKEICFRVDS